MAELKNYHISNISLDCITYDQAENYTKRHINKIELINIVSNLESDVVFYNRMIEENQEISDSIMQEIEQLKEMNEKRKRYIENNQDDALIRRGLADICFEYDTTERKIQRITCELGGILRSNRRAFTRLAVIQKALYQGRGLVRQFVA